MKNYLSFGGGVNSVAMYLHLKDQGVDLSKDQLALQRLKEAGEKAKIELSSTLETEINIPFITSDASGPKHLNIKMSRAKLEDLVGEYIDRAIETTKKVVADSKFKISDIDEIVLVGGQIRMPAIQEAVKKLFGKGKSLVAEIMQR